MITKDLISKGIDAGIVNIVPLWENDPSLPFSEMVCKIGSYWFYFGGQEAEDAPSITSYLLNTGKEHIEREIFEALLDMTKYVENDDELAYYESFLKEHLEKDKDI